eukprot:CAMPEP_0170634214 /NCGR_PEP_ID=MMETSP0224-20130122/36463_1 /TAXON_ID=285029 /ORGANISM="Togula jolla, Strain CCCM 725" /LENGTH=140 /DNA_ID=CAMNT_0010963421 /DNA_START=314 /DNA_END=736 /DNA_ORIENTATION=-
MPMLAPPTAHVEQADIHAVFRSPSNALLSKLLPVKPEEPEEAKRMLGPVQLGLLKKLSSATPQDCDNATSFTRDMESWSPTSHNSNPTPVGRSPSDEAVCTKTCEKFTRSVSAGTAMVDEPTGTEPSLVPPALSPRLSVK